VPFIQNSPKIQKCLQPDKVCSISTLPTFIACDITCAFWHCLNFIHDAHDAHCGHAVDLMALSKDLSIVAPTKGT